MAVGYRSHFFEILLGCQVSGACHVGTIPLPLNWPENSFFISILQGMEEAWSKHQLNIAKKPKVLKKSPS